ncbi:hypothetical protein ES703_31531 [subsurface metagenome]
MLSGAEELTRPAKFQILFCNLEAIPGLGHYFYSSLTLKCPGNGEHQTVGLILPSSNASS